MKTTTDVMVVAGVLVLIGVAGCSADAEGSGAEWVANVDTAADTITVRTVSGSTWREPVDLVEEVRIGTLEGPDEEMLGSVTGLAVDADGYIYVYDRQVPALRKYDPDGAFVATIGHTGGGPGEYANSDGGMAITADGRLVLRDPGNARFTLYRPDGEYDSEWLGRGGFFTSSPVVVDTAGFVYSSVMRQTRDGEDPWPGALWVLEQVKMAADGTPVDTLSIPRYRFERAELVAERDGGTSVNGVPFTPRFHWAVHPFGTFVTAVGDRYAVDLHQPDGGVLRFARDPEPVPVAAGEKQDAEARATANMRNTDPAWKWNGPPIPDTKPPITGLYAGQDGRVWVKLSAPAEAIPEDEREPEPDPGTNEPPPARFREPVVFDVFEPDGRYLGQVRAPRGFSTYPRPIFRADHVWAVVRDALDINYIVRFRIGDTLEPSLLEQSGS